MNKHEKKASEAKSDEFGSPAEEPVRLTFAVADNATSAMEAEALAVQHPPYEVETELEGKIESIQTHEAKTFCIYDPITDAPIECGFVDSDLSRVADLIKTQARVRVAGLAMYGSDDLPKSIKVREGGIAEFPPDSALPRISDLHAAKIDITGGRDSVEHVRGIRNAE